MHKTTTALIAAGVFLAVLLTVTGATWLGNGRHFGPPSQPRVEQAQAYNTDVTPTYDAQWNAYCPAGLALYDTGDDARGDHGVICTLPLMEV